MSHITPVPVSSSSSMLAQPVMSHSNDMSQKAVTQHPCCWLPSNSSHGDHGGAQDATTSIFLLPFMLSEANKAPDGLSYQ